MNYDDTQAASQGRTWRIALLVALVLCGCAATFLFDGWGWLEIVLARDVWRGPGGVALYVLLYTIWNFLLPPAPLQFFAAAQYGLLEGLAVIYLAASLSIVPGYIAGRVLGREWVRQHTGARGVMIERVIERMGWRGVALLRLSNLIPSNIANLLLGATALKLPMIVWASAIGGLPGYLLMAVLGSGSDALTTQGAQTPWWLYAIAALAIVALLGYATIETRKILRDEPPDGGQRA